MHNPVVDERPPTRLELALGQEHAPLIVLLMLFPLVCWWWIVVMARDMYGPMTGASAWMMTLQWDARHVFLLWAMWAVMMVGMMLPSATPMLLMYGVAARRRGLGSRAAREIYAMAAGYVAVWALFSVAATAAQRILSMRLIVSPMMTLNSPTIGAALLLVAGDGGVMNLAVVAALTAFVVFEKIGPFGVHGSRISGALLIAAGLWMLLASV